MHLAVIELEPRAGWSAVLEAGSVIGRHSSCDVHVPDPLVSRVHARVCAVGGTTALEDLGSHNGTYVNGARCGRITLLQPGDRLRLGTTSWVVVPLPALSRSAAANGHASRRDGARLVHRGFSTRSRDRAAAAVQD